MTPGRVGGFTLLELLVATAVSVVALGILVSLTLPAGMAYRSLPEAADSQQRLRIAVQAVAADLGAAGAGPALGWGASANVAWPSILPCRLTGTPLSQVAGGCARADALTVLTVDEAAPQALTTSRLATVTAPLTVAPVSACGLASAACRFHQGARVLMYDGTGAWDLAAVTALSTDGSLISHDQDRLSRLYGPGAFVAESHIATYAIRADPSAGTLQLRRGSGGGTDYPLVDHVAGFEVSYEGEALGPVVSELGDPVERTSSYGPLPPPAGVDDVLDTWPAGENCTTMRVGERTVSRLTALVADADGLASLPVSMFSDGPWCPDEWSPNRFDADLLRIRLVRITIRVQAPTVAARGANLALFSAPGASRDTGRWVPDLEVHADVVPRSMRR